MEAVPWRRGSLPQAQANFDELLKQLKGCYDRVIAEKEKAEMEVVQLSDEKRQLSQQLHRSSKHNRRNFRKRMSAPLVVLDGLLQGNDRGNDSGFTSSIDNLERRLYSPDSKDSARRASAPELKDAPSLDMELQDVAPESDLIEQPPRSGSSEQSSLRSPQSRLTSPEIGDSPIMELDLPNSAPVFPAEIDLPNSAPESTNIEQLPRLTRRDLELSALSECSSKKSSRHSSKNSSKRDRGPELDDSICKALEQHAPPVPEEPKPLPPKENPKETMPQKQEEERPQEARDSTASPGGHPKIVRESSDSDEGSAVGEDTLAPLGLVAAREAAKEEKKSESNDNGPLVYLSLAVPQSSVTRSETKDGQSSSRRLSRLSKSDGTLERRNSRRGSVARDDEGDDARKRRSSKLETGFKNGIGGQRLSVLGGRPVGNTVTFGQEFQQAQLLQIWENVSTHVRADLRAGDGPSGVITAKDEEPRDLKTTKDDSKCIRTLSYLVATPSSMKRITYEVIGMFLILYDLIWLPIQIFDPPQDIVTDFIGWCTSIYWTLDIPASFFVGFFVPGKGVIDMRLPSIAKNYVKKWFTFDIIVVLLDWVLAITDLAAAGDNQEGSTSNANGVGYMRIGKAVRLLRLLRLVRLLKAQRALADLIEKIQSETMLIIVGIGKLLMFILLFNHVLACCWFAVGIIDMGKMSWVTAENLSDAGPMYQYLTALHWSLTQFTPASMEVTPKNEVERAFTLIVILSAMCIFSSFISAITNAIAQLRNINSERNDQFARLRRYFLENQISVPLMASIWSCLHQAMTKSRKRVHEDELSILSLLPKTIRCKLAQEVYSPILSAHPFFRAYAKWCPGENERLFLEATCSISLATSHEAFSETTEADSIFWIVTGKMTYQRNVISSTNTDLDNIARVQALHSGQWVAEPVIWLQWKHMGCLIANTHCELVAMEATKVQKIMAQQGESTEGVRRYARAFAKYAQRNQEKVSDVWSDEVVLEEMVGHAFVNEESEHFAVNTEMRERRHTQTRRSTIFGGLSTSKLAMPADRKSVASAEGHRGSLGELAAGIAGNLAGFGRKSVESVGDDALAVQPASSSQGPSGHRSQIPATVQEDSQAALAELLEDAQRRAAIRSNFESSSSSDSGSDSDSGSESSFDGDSKKDDNESEKS